MNLQQQRIHALCEELKLPAFSTQWSALAQRAADTQASFADFLTSLLESEQAARTERIRTTLLKLATLPTVKTVESYDFSFATGAPKQQIHELASLSFIERAENLVGGVRTYRGRRRARATPRTCGVRHASISLGCQLMAFRSITRRHAVTLIGALGAGSLWHATRASPIDIPAQPYFANVRTHHR